MSKQDQYANSINGACEELEMLREAVKCMSDEQVNSLEFRSAYTDFINSLDSLLNVSR